ncbi:uncharacterized protein [Ptychodera flava]|uniref:uncharacterized protein n=1 Tax=Ptychodera flava TaxID=63121 RepID=UPI00396A688F
MEGAIASPGYPAAYPNDVDCEYQIQVPEGYIVQLTFEDIEVEYSSDCAYDYIAVYDGPDSSSELMGIYCGVANKIDKLPSGILRSSSRSMCVKFTSDAGIQYRGFKATFLAGAVMAYTEGRSTFAHQVFENSTSIDTAITDNTGFDISGETDVTPIIAGSVVGILFLSVVTLSVWYMKKVYQKKRIAAALESEEAQEGEGAEGALPEEEETEDTYLFMKESAEGIQIPTDLLTAKESAEGIEIGAEGHVQKAPLPQAQPLTVPAAIPQPPPLQRRGLPPLGRPTQVAPEMSVEGFCHLFSRLHFHRSSQLHSKEWCHQGFLLNNKP